MQTTGYHTLQDRGNPREIELEGPRYCYRNDAWLGRGYYFWDTDITWAHRWKKSDNKGYMICEAQLLIDENTFDLLGNVAHQKRLQECAAILSAHAEKDVSVYEVVEYLKKHLDFPYNSIRAFDDPNPVRINYDNKRTEQLTLNKRVQICLIDKTNLILNSFKVIFPERYLK